VGTDVGVQGLAAGESETAGEALYASGYRPQLDGLRALAVYLVLFFHAGSGVFTGGYIGVDVFFVLSGFLVTQLLLRDFTRAGAIRFGRFYSRRFRRLLPAAFVALIITALIFRAVTSSVEAFDTIGSFQAAFLYVTNWYFIHQSQGYFGTNLDANPVLQFWSLAVEEQFYLLWPLMLAGALAFTRPMPRPRQLRTIQVAVAIGAVASATWALSLQHRAPNRAYYGTDARAYELLAGALIALSPGLVHWAKARTRAVRMSAVVNVLALLFVATAWVDLDAIPRGIAATVVTFALIIALEGGGGGVVIRTLSQRTIVYLGKISYGTYLWHWIIIIVLLRTFHTSSASTISIDCLVATALAALSFEVLEHPVRLSRLLDRHRALVIGSGLTVSVISALVLIPHILGVPNGATAQAQGLTSTGFTPVPSGLDLAHADAGQRTFLNCEHKPVSACTVRHGHGESVLVIGDSHAQMLVPAFLEIAAQRDLTLSVSTRGLCPWAPDDGGPGGADVGHPDLTPSSCRAIKADLVHRVIPALRPDIVIATDRGYPSTNAVNLDDEVSKLRAAGAKKVVIVKPTPLSSGLNPRTCLSQAASIEQCRYLSSLQPSDAERQVRALAARRTGVYALDIDRLICPFLPICDPVIHNILVKWDGGHITYKYAQYIAPQIDKALANAGVIPPR